MYKMNKNIVQKNKKNIDIYNDHSYMITNVSLKAMIYD